MTDVYRFQRVLVLLLVVGICSAADAGLIHRYSFNDNTANDSVGNVNGTLKGSAKIVDGKLVLDNGDKTCDDAGLSYLEFNGSVLPAKGTSVSLVIWITAKENPQFARILDIGDKADADGQAFIYLTCRHEDDQSRAAITATDTGSKTYISGPRLDDGKPHMAAIVIDGTAKQLHLFVDGKESATAEDLGDNTLDQVRPVHNWIGKSGFDADTGLSASIDEFRVYDNPLTADEVAAINKAGPDELPATQPSK
ncbi:MAG: LamG domain-containing protein [Tepidisphaeraceae bacterium]|jgi:hypothetical protein